ncbi:MAG: hypothetical protein JHC95_23440, partial [Solirubrobacteraceae bacterium]|nr:hypothetical protein [Solirubrobacteraceae bacterium]
WVSAVSVYDEHLLRDFGAAQLGITVVLLGAAWFLERRLVQVALVAMLASSVPHFLFHTTTTGSLATIDNVLSLGGFLALIALAAWLLTQTRLPTTRRPAWPASPDSRPRPVAR